jgi:hypothetical protein
VAHHDPDPVVIPQCLRGEIAEHPEMAVLTINAIFRGVMRVE